MLTGITLENFKAFKDRQFIPIKPITLVFGPNNAGKSSIFHALAFLKYVFETKGYCDPDSVNSGWSKVHLGSWLNLVHGHDSSAEMKITLHYDDSSIQWVFRIDPSKGATPRVDRFQIERDDRVIAKGTNTAAMGIRWKVELHRDHQIWKTLGSSLLKSLHNIPTDQKISELFQEHFHRWIGEWRPLPECLQDDSVVLSLFPSHLSDESFDVIIGVSYFGDPDSKEEKVKQLLEALGNDGVPEIDRCLDVIEEAIILGNPDKQMEVDFHSLLHIGSNRPLPETLITERHLPPTPNSEPWRILLRNNPEEYYPPQERVNRMMETLEVELFVRKRLRKEIAFPDIEVSYDELVFADSGGVFHPIHSFGLGVGTILPVLVGLAASDAELLIIEEPECHVHPRVQSCIGDLIIERALESHDSEPHPDDLDCGSSIGWEETSPNRHVIVETHSEHLILRILRRIREKTLGKLPDGINPITKDDVAVLFVSPSFEGAIVRELRITDKGKFLDSWPGGFFEESFDEMF